MDTTLTREVIALRKDRIEVGKLSRLRAINRTMSPKGSRQLFDDIERHGVWEDRVAIRDLEGSIMKKGITIKDVTVVAGIRGIGREGRRRGYDGSACGGTPRYNEW
jgi:hypothetical protein